MPRDPKKAGKATAKAGKGKKKGDDDDDDVFFKSKTLQKLAKDTDSGKGAKGAKGKGGKRVIQAKSAAEAQKKVATARKKATEQKSKKKEYANFDGLSDDEDEDEIAKKLARDAARADRMGLATDTGGVEKSEKRAKKEASKLERQLNQKFDHYQVEAVITFEGSEKQDEKAGEEDTGEQDCLRIRPFSLSFHGNQLFKEASVTFSVGERYGLVGPNGSGKSTVLRQISARKLPGVTANLDLLHVEQEADGTDESAIDSVLAADEVRLNLLKEKDELEIEKEGLSEEEEAKRAARLAIVYSELAAIGADQAPARAAKILAGLQFTPEMQKQATKEFSGGWRMRIALARALFRQPSLLLLDEPTNHLDLHAVIWLEEYLRRTWKKTLVIVSHDRAFLNNVCTRIVHLDQQKLIPYKGDFETFQKTLETKRRTQQNLYEKQQKLLAEGKRKLHGDQKAGGKARKGASKQMTTQVKKQKERDLEKLQSQLVDKVQKYSVEFDFPDPQRQLDHPVIQVDDVAFSYPARDGTEPKKIFDKVNFGIDMEARIALVGPNGCGKSTLLGLLFGKLKPTSGQVTINKHLRIGHFAQHFADQLDLNISPFQYLARSFPDVKGTGRGDPYRKALGQFGLPADAHNQPIATLSGGQKNRVIFASIALMEPDILYLDEPTNHLDMESIEALSDALERYEGGVIVVSHDARLIDSVCEQVWIVGDCKVEPLIVNNEFGDIFDYRQSLIEKLTDDDF